jgi:hypothetical protein
LRELLLSGFGRLRFGLAQRNLFLDRGPHKIGPVL